MSRCKRGEGALFAGSPNEPVPKGGQVQEKGAFLAHDANLTVALPSWRRPVERYCTGRRPRVVIRAPFSPTAVQSPSVQGTGFWAT